VSIGAVRHLMQLRYGDFFKKLWNIGQSEEVVKCIL